MRVVIAQINYKADNLQSHVRKIKNVIRTYKTSDLIIFPELILHGHPSYERPEPFLYRKMKKVSVFVSGDLYRHVKTEKATVIIGELKQSGDRYYNVATYVDPSSVQTYAKTHIHWTENFVPGAALKVFHSPMGEIGITICFDAAFTEVWRVLALMGARILVNIAAVPASFSPDYMRRRLAGAAINNQCFVIYANRPGPHFSGYSGVFGPRGEIQVEAGSGEKIIEAEIDLEAIDAWRQEERLYPNRRPLLYRQIARRPSERPSSFPAQGDRATLHNFSIQNT
jgi:predicted amidohydrolase